MGVLLRFVDIAALMMRYSGTCENMQVRFFASINHKCDFSQVGHAMTLSELIDEAAEKMGEQKQLAAAMGKHPSRLSEWKKGKTKPDAHEIAFMAKIAGRPVLSTVAEIKAQLDERYASVWTEALGKLTAAGVAASVLACAFGLSPTPANATGTQSKVCGSVYYVNRRKSRGAKRVRLPDPQMRGANLSFVDEVKGHAEPTTQTDGNNGRNAPRTREPIPRGHRKSVRRDDQDG